MREARRGFPSMDMFTSREFWLAVGQIILIDILLGGDNAVVIALACRKLPPNLRTKGIMWGTAGAIGVADGDRALISLPVNMAVRP